MSETVYHYHSESRCLIGSAPVQLDPIEHKPLVPAFATLVPPPSLEVNQAAVFDPVNGVWTVVPDHRGVIYWLTDGSQHTVSTVGEILPDTALLAPPAPPPLTDAELVNAVRDAVYAYLDSVAVAKGFRNSDVMIALAGRTNSNPMVNALVQAFADYYELVHGVVYAKAEEVYNGAPAPTPEQVVAFIKANHPMNWPI